MVAALGLAERGVGRTAPNPSVGCIIVKDGRVIGRGWTQPGGRPHAEAMALAQAGEAAQGSSVYVTLEPCAHASARGPACTASLIDAGVARVVGAVTDPDQRTAGAGFARLRAAGIEVAADVERDAGEALNAAFFTRQRLKRPYVTLKLALSLDGCLALTDGSSRWITGPQARAHAHLERVRCDVLVVGRGTLDADDPALDVRLDGLEDRSPRVAVLSRTLEAIPTGKRLSGARVLHSLDELDDDGAIASILVEGGAGVATSLLAADRIDRLLIYRAPVLLGGRPALGDIGLRDLTAAHGRWRLQSAQALGVDRVEQYVRTRYVDAALQAG